MAIELPAALFRSGTSKGLYLLREDLDRCDIPADALLASIMGAPDASQLDGVGGGSTTTSKVAIVGKSDVEGIDVEYLFAQVDPESGTVDWAPTCGNILAGVGPFAIERGLVPVHEGVTTVCVRLTNTHARAALDVSTLGGTVNYSGSQVIEGVHRSAAPIHMTFSQFIGGTTGQLLPTGNPTDVVAGVEVSCVDSGVCAVLARAEDVGLTGAESPTEINANLSLLSKVEDLRRKAADLMGLGDVCGRVVPKVILLSRSEVGTIRSRYLVPASCHPTHAVSGAINIVTALTIPGTVAQSVQPIAIGAGVIAIEHPAGIMNLAVTAEQGAPVGVHLMRTARKLFDGVVFCEL